jgi:hypothetical protein
MAALSEPKKKSDGAPGSKEDGKKSKSAFPPWLGMAIKKPRVWKTWVRCMIATFATLVLMLVQPCKLSHLGRDLY